MAGRMLRWELLTRQFIRQGHLRTGQRQTLVARSLCSTRPILDSTHQISKRTPSRHIDDFDVHSLESSAKDVEKTLRGLLDLLNTGKGAKVLQLPSETTRIDAYLHFKRYCPQMLSQVTDVGLARLCLQASTERLGGIIGSLLEDLEGHAIFHDDTLDSESKPILEALTQTRRVSRGGVFAALPGSQRRFNAVQNLLLGSTQRRSSELEGAEEEAELDRKTGRAEALLSSTTLERAFKMLLEDIQIINGRKGEKDVQRSSVIPADFDTRVARRLIRTIAASKLGHLESILSELVNHVNQDRAYDFLSSPTDGWQLLDYYLSVDENQKVVVPIFPRQASSSSTQDLPASLQAANAILSRMATLQPEVIDEAMLESVSKEGQRYKGYLEEQGIPSNEAAKQSIRYTLRNIIILLLLKTKRYSLLVDHLGHLIDGVDTVAVEDGTMRKPSNIPAELVLDSIYLTLTSAEDDKTAFQLAQRFVGTWMQAQDTEQVATLLQSLCNKAVDINKPFLASDLLLSAVKQSDQRSSQMAAEVEIVGGPTILRILDNHRSNGRVDYIATFMQQLGIVDSQGTIKDDTIDRVFPEPLRARLIIILARARLRRQVKALYERWGVPLETQIEPEQVNDLVGQIIQPMSQKIPSMNDRSSRVSSNDVDASVRGSSTCVMHLVRLFRSKALAFAIIEEEVHNSKEERNRLLKNPNNQFAYHVLVEFHKVQPYSRYVERSTFVDLAKSYLYLGHRKVAFKCLQDTIDREDSSSLDEAIVLINLMGRIDLEEATKLIVECMPLWIDIHAGNEEKLAQMYSPLLESAMQRGQRDLVGTLLQSAQSNRLEGESGLQSIEVLIRFALGSRQTREDILKSDSSDGAQAIKSGPGAETAFIARWTAERMKRYNWKPSPRFISWMAINAIRPGGLTNARWQDGIESTSIEEETEEYHKEEKQDSHSTSDDASQRDKRNKSRYSLLSNELSASIQLLLLAANHLNYLDLGAANEIVRCIQNCAFHANQKRRKEGPVFTSLTRDLDTVTSLLRWTPTSSVPKRISTNLSSASSSSSSGQSSQYPNKLAASLYRDLMVTYMRVGDLLGAASILTWARDEANLSYEQLALGWKGHHRGFKNFIKDIAYKTHLNNSIPSSTFLAWLAGRESVPKSKMWWQRPDNSR